MRKIKNHPMEPLNEEIVDLRRSLDARSSELSWLLDEGDLNSEPVEVRSMRVLTPRQRARMREAQGPYLY